MPIHYFFHPLHDVQEINILLNMINIKSAGPDGLHPTVIKNAAQNISMLVHIFNNSLETGIVPERLKIAKITPIFFQPHLINSIKFSL